MNFPDHIPDGARAEFLQALEDYLRLPDSIRCDRRPVLLNMGDFWETRVIQNGAHSDRAAAAVAAYEIRYGGENKRLALWN
jgi:hypothetical protein